MSDVTREVADESWRDQLREHAYATDWRSAVGHRLHWLHSLICQRDGARLPCGVQEALETAQAAITNDRRGWSRIRSWWSGWDAERAWSAVHTAEALLVASSVDLGSRLGGISEQVAKELSASDRRLKALEQLDADDLKSADPGVVELARAVVREAMLAAFRIGDEALRRVRVLRNQMLIFGSLLALFNVLLIVIGLTKPALIPLCVPKACPTGSGATDTWPDVWLVQLFGALGAVVAVVVLLLNGQPKLATYELTGYQSLVKVMLGAALAVIGTLGLAAGAFETVVSTTQALLFAALLLGYAQQLATQFLDSTAQHLVSQAKTGTVKGT